MFRQTFRLSFWLLWGFFNFSESHLIRNVGLISFGMILLAIGLYLIIDEYWVEEKDLNTLIAASGTSENNRQWLNRSDYRNEYSGAWRKWNDWQCDFSESFRGKYYLWHILRSHPRCFDKSLFPFWRIRQDELTSVLQTTQPDTIVSSLRGDFAEQESRHQELAEYLLATGGRLVFLSTANVFDGCPFEPHSENNTPYPASSYGQFKFRCEQMLQKILGDRLTIVRLPKVLSQYSVQKLLTKQNPKQPFSLYSNLFMSANIAENVANEIRFIIEHELSGIFHLTSNDFMTYRNFYEKLFTEAGFKGIIVQKISISIKRYCAELGNVSVGVLHGNDTGKFYFGLSSSRNNLPSEFLLTCQNVIEKLCLCFCNN